VPSVSPVEVVEDPDEEAVDHAEHEKGQDRREVDRARRGQQPAEDAQVRLADVVEEALDPVERGRVRQAQPTRDDVGEDHEPVEQQEHVDEGLDLRNRVGKQHEPG
jgi:hypothetical protein